MATRKQRRWASELGLNLSSSNKRAYDQIARAIDPDYGKPSKPWKPPRVLSPQQRLAKIKRLLKQRQKEQTQLEIDALIPDLINTDWDSLAEGVNKDILLEEAIAKLMLLGKYAKRHKGGLVPKKRKRDPLGKVLD